jgi:membrane-bound lytic murein transglycosylase D
VADVTNSTVPEIVALNPALLRLSTPNNIPYDLHLPPGSKQMFLDRLKDIPEEDRANWRFHVVKDGETLDTIAAALHVRSAEIASFNELTPGAAVGSGDELVIPVQPASFRAGTQRYKPRRGDTLVTVADRFGVSVEQLRDWNHLSSGRLTPGRAIYVSEPVHLAPVRLAPGAHAARGGHTRAATRASLSAEARAGKSRNSAPVATRSPAAKSTAHKGSAAPSQTTTRAASSTGKKRKH